MWLICPCSSGVLTTRAHFNILATSWRIKIHLSWLYVKRIWSYPLFPLSINWETEPNKEVGGRKKKGYNILTNFLVLSCVQQWKNETKQVKYCFHVLILIIQSSYCDVVGHQMNQSTSVRNSYGCCALLTLLSMNVTKDLSKFILHLIYINNTCISRQFQINTRDFFFFFEWGIPLVFYMINTCSVKL